MRRDTSAQPQIEQQYYSYKQAGQYLGKSAESIRGLVNRGLIKATKTSPKGVLISRAELDRFAAGLPPEPGILRERQIQEFSGRRRTKGTIQ